MARVNSLLANWVLLLVLAPSAAFAQSGFTSANYLCRVFKQNVGVTCATFRAQPWLAGP